jgi:hypothetical protein
VQLRRSRSCGSLAELVAAVPHTYAQCQQQQQQQQPEVLPELGLCASPTRTQGAPAAGSAGSLSRQLFAA